MSVIGIDLDGTLAKDGEWISPDVVHNPNPHAVLLIKELHRRGHHLYIWSCRADYIVEKWLDKHDLRHYFAGINTSPGTSDSVKPNFDYCIGDEMLTWTGNNGGAILDHITAHPKTERFTTDRDIDFMSRQPLPYLAGTGRAYLDMFEPHWRRLWHNHFPCGKYTAFLTICSHAKPYSKSFIHASIQRELYEAYLLTAVDYIHISNAGIIPSGHAMTYPFNAYDWDSSNLSDEVKSYFIDLTTDRLTYWATKYAHNYRQIIVYLRPEGKTITAVKQALSAYPLHIIPVDTSPEQYPSYAALADVDDCLTSNDNLQRLIATIRECIA